MADLAALDEHCAWMRSNRVSFLRNGDVSIQLELPPIAQPASVPQELAPPTPEDAADAELRDLETLLLSSGADPTMFLRAAYPPSFLERLKKDVSR